MPEQGNETVTELDVLEGLAPLAKKGIRALFVVAKLKGAPIRKVNKETGVVTIKADAIVGEGDMMTLKFAENSALPGPGFLGAFLIDPPREFMNKTSANVLGFA